MIMDKTMQEIFDDFENKSIQVEEAKKVLDSATLPDLKDKDYISAEEADAHLIAAMERERAEKILEDLSAEWGEIQDVLVGKLCKINTKVMVKDKRDGSDVLIHCEGGYIIIEEAEK